MVGQVGRLRIPGITLDIRNQIPRADGYLQEMHFSSCCCCSTMYGCDTTASYKVEGLKGCWINVTINGVVVHRTISIMQLCPSMEPIDLSHDP